MRLSTGSRKEESFEEGLKKEYPTAQRQGAAG